MKVKEKNVVIKIDNGEEFETICRKFCLILWELQQINDPRHKQAQHNLAKAIIDTLLRQFSEK